MQSISCHLWFGFLRARRPEGDSDIGPAQVPRSRGSCSQPCKGEWGRGSQRPLSPDRLAEWSKHTRSHGWNPDSHILYVASAFLQSNLIFFGLKICFKYFSKLDFIWSNILKISIIKPCLSILIPLQTFMTYVSVFPQYTKHSFFF